jgi:hypothetical protein
MKQIREEIEEMVHKETRAWDGQDVETLLSLFHPDMVWPWPLTAQTHDPAQWVITQGRFHYDRWKKGWQDIFNTHSLVHNNRKIITIKVSEQSDGAFAEKDQGTYCCGDLGDQEL